MNHSANTHTHTETSAPGRLKMNSRFKQQMELGFYLVDLDMILALLHQLSAQIPSELRNKPETAPVHTSNINYSKIPVSSQWEENLVCHATSIHFPSLKLVLSISSKLPKRGLSPFPVLNFCSTCLINASLQCNPWQHEFQALHQGECQWEMPMEE